MANKQELETSIMDRIGELVKDTLTLDVLTLSGQVDLKPATDDGGDGGGGPGKFSNMEDLFKQVMQELEVADSTAINVVAYTHAQWDQDSVHFVAEGANEAWVNTHRETVAQAHESRVKALQTAADIIKGL